jgi:hypothetical protein
VAKIEGNFLEFVLPVRSFAHLTTQHRISSGRLSGAFLTWIGRIQAHHKLTLGWVRSIEPFPKAHIHAALIAAAPLDCVFAALLWQEMVSPRYSEAAIVEPYRRGLCGLGYILKQLGNPAAGIQYSENIAAFAPGSGKSLFRTSSAQRRQIRRIKAEIRRADPEAVLLSQATPAGGSAPVRTAVREEARQ